MKGFLSSLKGKIIAGIAGGAVVVAGVVVSVVVVTAPKDYRTIKIEELNGQTVISNESVTEQEAYKGMNLKSGDVVTVQKDGNMTLLLDMDKYMFADEGTKFKVEASGNSEKSNTKTKIVLEEGSVLCRIDSKLGDEETFEVETPNSVMSVRGTIFKMTIYKDENGENYARVDVLEGSVKVDLYSENGEKTGEEGLIEAGQAATVHSNPEISEFVIGDSDITYDDFSEVMASFVIETIDDGREICIGEDLFKHYTGLENHPETATVVKEATCKEEGAQEIYCSTCDIVVRTEPIKTTEHTPGEWIVEENTTCVERRRCTVCNEIIEEREADFEKHDLERETVETKEGCNVHIVVQDTCKACKMSQEVSSRNEVRHTYGNWQTTTSAGCTTTGVRQMVCGVCGNIVSEDIGATGHSYGSWETVKAATCTTIGSEERECNNCGDTISRELAVTGHSYGSWKTVKAATCTTAGSEERECSNCGDTISRGLAVTGHSYGNWKTVKAATCTTAGSQERECGNCGNKETASISATGHNYQKYAETAATCTNAGERQDKCTVCGDIIKTAISELGHSIIYTHEYYTPNYNSATFTASYVGTCERCEEILTTEEHSGIFVDSETLYKKDLTCECGHKCTYSF